jgi:hypothetical protein
MQITFLERELEDFLCTGKNLEKHLELRFIARQVNIAPAGIVDILAYSKQSKCFVIVELKKELLDSSALLQGLAYLRYYRDVRGFNLVHRRKSRKFSLLLIGQNLSSDLTKVINYSDEDTYFNDQECYYKLFNLNFEKGVSFDYFSKEQENYQTRLNEAMEAFERVAYCFLQK